MDLTSFVIRASGTCEVAYCFGDVCMQHFIRGEAIVYKTQKLIGPGMIESFVEKPQLRFNFATSYWDTWLLDIRIPNIRKREIAFFSFRVRDCAREFVAASSSAEAWKIEMVLLLPIIYLSFVICKKFGESLVSQVHLC